MKVYAKKTIPRDNQGIKTLYSKHKISRKLAKNTPAIDLGNTILGERESVNSPAKIPPKVMPRLLAEAYLDKSNLEISENAYRSRKIGRVSCHSFAAIRPVTIVIKFHNFGSTMILYIFEK